MSTVNAQETPKTFGNSNDGFQYWGNFWNKFNSHSNWNLQYNFGFGWNDIKEDLTVIRDYQSYNFNGTGFNWESNVRNLSSRVKLTLDFTASYTADYRLIFAVELDCLEYVQVNAYRLNITYSDYQVYFDFSDLKDIPNLIYNHGTTNHNGEEWFYWIVRRNNINAGSHIVLDPSFGETGTGSGDWSISANYKIGSIFTLSEAGTINNIGCCLTNFGNGEHAKCMVYEVSGGVPTSLLATSDEIEDGVEGWNDFSIDYEASSGDYCLAVIVDSLIKTRYTSDSQNLFRNSDTYSDGASNPYGSSDVFDYHFSIYANYTTGGGINQFETFYPNITVTSSLIDNKELFRSYSSDVGGSSSLESNIELGNLFYSTSNTTTGLNYGLEQLFYTEGSITSISEIVTGFEGGLNIFEEITETENPTATLVYNIEKLIIFEGSVTVVSELVTATETFLGFYEVITQTPVITALLVTSFEVAYEFTGAGLFVIALAIAIMALIVALVALQ